MKAYKLFKERKDGTIGPLFINARQRVPFGEWLEAEEHPTKGFAYRPGWHCTFTPNAPHIKENPKHGTRVWCEIEVEDWATYARPESQGGAWILANKIKVIRKLS